MDSSVPLLTIFTNYSEWKKKMIASLMRQGLYGVSIGLGEDFFSENEWLNECDPPFEKMTLTLSPHHIRYISSVLFIAFLMAHPVELLTSFNYHQWKEDMEGLLHTKKLFKLTKETEVEPILNHDK